MTFKRKLIRINKSPRRIKRDAGGRNKNPVDKILVTPKVKPKVNPSVKLYIKFSRKRRSTIK